MNRPITGFFQDAQSDWAARLSCGHTQHTRHNPPLADRAWVLLEDGRRSRLGTELNCLLCDQGEMPVDHIAYQRTGSFTEKTVPSGLTTQHSTKPGVWGLIHVESGALEYLIEDDRMPLVRQRAERLEVGRPGVVVSEVKHRVRPLGSVEFYVEFWRSGKERS